MVSHWREYKTKQIKDGRMRSIPPIETHLFFFIRQCCILINFINDLFLFVIICRLKVLLVLVNVILKPTHYVVAVDVGHFIIRKKLVLNVDILQLKLENIIGV